MMLKLFTSRAKETKVEKEAKSESRNVVFQPQQQPSTQPLPLSPLLQPSTSLKLTPTPVVNSRTVSFPTKLYNLLEVVDKDIMEWLPNNRSFRITNIERFSNEVIPLYWKHCKLTSFQRQLNLYGFRRIIKGGLQGAYYHPKFQLGRRDLLLEIVRVSKATTLSDMSNPNSPPTQERSHSTSSETGSTKRTLLECESYDSQDFVATSRSCSFDSENRSSFCSTFSYDSYCDSTSSKKRQVTRFESFDESCESSLCNSSAPSPQYKQFDVQHMLSFMTEDENYFNNMNDLNDMGNLGMGIMNFNNQNHHLNENVNDDDAMFDECLVMLSNLS